MLTLSAGSRELWEVGVGVLPEDHLLPSKLSEDMIVFISPDTCQTSGPRGFAEEEKSVIRSIGHRYHPLRRTSPSSLPLAQDQVGNLLE